MSSPLEEIPGVGPRIAAVMEALGITLPDSIANSENLVMMEQE